MSNAKFPGLPGGRGTRRGDQYIDQQEAQEGLRRSIPEAIGDFFSPMLFEGNGTQVANFVPTLGRVLWTPVGRVPLRYVLREAAINVTALVAGNTIYAAIYYVDPARAFRMVPGSLATFSGASTGVKRFTLPHDVTVSSGRFYYIGVLSVGGAGGPTIIGLNNANWAVYPARYVAGATTLPSATALAGTTRASLAVPLITYLSQEAQALL